MHRTNKNITWSSGQPFHAIDHDRWWLLYKSANFRSAMFHVINKHSVLAKLSPLFFVLAWSFRAKLTKRDTGRIYLLFFYMSLIGFHPVIARIINARFPCVKRNVTSNWHPPREGWISWRVKVTGFDAVNQHSIIRRTDCSACCIIKCTNKPF